MVKQFVKYCIVGLGNTAIGLGLIYLAMGVFGLSPALSNFTGFAIAFIVSFSVNRAWTFQSNAHLGRSLAVFAAVCAGGYLLNLGAMLTAIHFAGVNAYFAQLFGVVTYAAFVFLGSRFLVFRH
jgi:putative flippase GtrA